ncbi:DUF5719 family protein [Luteococcus sp. H138]|uniref:DUF5719 family protein n=1 Tax=unclassified Luteococcus TaxID=2639923 RepID=UPI00313B7198
MITARDVLPAGGVLLSAAVLSVAGLVAPSLLAGPDTTGAVAMEVTRALACPSAPLGESTARLLDNSSGRDEVASRLAGSDPASPARVLPAGAHQATGGVWLSGLPRPSVSWWGACQPGTADQMVQLANPAKTKLLLVNPGTVDAEVDITLYGTEGPLQAIGTSGITVPAGRQALVPVSVQAPAGKPVGARIVASQGRVAAWALVDDGVGADYVPATAPENSAVIPTVPMGSTSSVLLTNPSDQRTTVRMVAHSRRGAFDPSGAAETVLEPGTTTLVDVSRSFAGEAGSLSLSSDQPVAATLWASSGKDLAFTPAQAPSSGRSTLLLPAAGSVLFTNPEATDRQVSVTQPGGGSRDWTVPAGGVVSIDVAQAGLVSFTSGVAAGAVVSSPGLSIIASQDDGRVQAVPRLEQDPGLR